MKRCFGIFGELLTNIGQLIAITLGEFVPLFVRLLLGFQAFFVRFVANLLRLVGTDLVEFGKLVIVGFAKLFFVGVQGRELRL